jgi:hypothetical protein
MPLQQTSGNVTADAYGGNGGVSIIPNYIEDIFSTWLYDGTSAAQTITNGIDLAGKGGMVWIKSRSVAFDHYLQDTARGADFSLASNTLGASFSSGQMTAFNSNGFTLSGFNATNGNSNTYASWTLRKQPKFFDVVTYTGTGSARTVAHALGSVPGCMIVKQTSAASNWRVYHNGLTSAQYTISLNTTAAQSAQASVWNSTAPTSTVFTVGADLAVNDIGQTYVAYIFAHNAGGFGLTGTDNVISCGSYTGTGSPLSVTLGYEPQWILVKRATGGTNDWILMDTMRGMSLSQVSWLYPNTSAVEDDAGAQCNPTATGFTITSSGTNLNAGASTYIYIAIRRGPMKVPTDGTKVFNGIARTGTGATAVVTGVGFTPDMSMTKRRNGISTTPAMLDRLRGAPQAIYPTSNGAEVSDTTIATSFNMDGITFGNQTGVNGSGFTYINWFFQRAPGFFDEVCYTGTGANRTVTHNLAAVPEMMIVKPRSNLSNWIVYTSPTGNTNYMFVNDVAASAASSLYWNNTSPTSSVFTVGTQNSVNQSGITYVAYLFATCPGVSKVGFYTGNGTTQAIACGFAGGARFVLIKRTDAVGDWYTYDTTRGMTTVTDPYLRLNSTAAEVATLGSVTTTTGGFTVNAAILAAINTNAASYIFLAIA